MTLCRCDNQQENAWSYVDFQNIQVVKNRWNILIGFIPSMYFPRGTRKVTISCQLRFTQFLFRKISDFSLMHSTLLSLPSKHFAISLPDKFDLHHRHHHHHGKHDHDHHYHHHDKAKRWTAAQADVAPTGVLVMCTQPSQPCNIYRRVFVFV